MSYLGKVALKASDIRRLDVTSSTSATHTLTWTPPNEQSLIITINGVKQQNNYSISGVTLTLDTALVATDEMEVIGINDIGTTTVPGDGTVTTSKIEDDAVTADKLANSINTEIAANTAKVTNATHTGDVTGATALTIANDAVDIAMLSATGTASATTFLRGDNAWESVPGGLSDASIWRLTTDFTNNATPIASNWEAADTYGAGTLGSAMTESSGIFTFPSTGFWIVTFNTDCSGNSTNYAYNHSEIRTTTDDSNYYVVAIGYSNMDNGAANGSPVTAHSSASTIFDVTSTANCKVRFDVSSSATTYTKWHGDTNQNETYAVFMRLGDT